MTLGYSASKELCESRAKRLGINVVCDFNMEKTTTKANEACMHEDGRVFFAVGKPLNKGASPPKVALVHLCAARKDDMWEFCRDKHAPLSPYTFDSALGAMCVHINDAPTKLYFDLDAPGVPSNVLEKWARDLIKCAEEFAHKSGWVASTAGREDDSTPPFFITTKHRPDRSSVHGISRTLHFSDIRAQAVFWNKFWFSPRHRALKEQCNIETKNKNAIGFFDMAVYGNPRSLSPLRKWYITGRQAPPGLTIQDEDPTDIAPGSQLVKIPEFMWGPQASLLPPLKRKRDAESPSPNLAVQYQASSFPGCVSRFMEAIARSLGTSVNSLRLSPDTSSSKTSTVDLWVGYPSNLGKECVHQKGKTHRKNRRQIGIRYKYYGDGLFPCWMERCYSENHPPGVKKWVRRDTEQTCQDPPPPNEPGPGVVEPKGLCSLLKRENPTSIYIDVPVVSPFRIKIRGYRDITNRTKTCTPYMPETPGLPFSSVLRENELMSEDYTRLCFPLRKRKPKRARV